MRFGPGGSNAVWWSKHSVPKNTVFKDCTKSTILLIINKSIIQGSARSKGGHIDRPIIINSKHLSQHELEENNRGIQTGGHALCKVSYDLVEGQTF